MPVPRPTIDRARRATLRVARAPWARALLGTALALGCSDSPSGTGATRPGDSVALVAALSSAPASAEPVAYISLPPGALPRGRAARIRVVRSGSTVTVPLVDGGFDPMPIGASSGDEIEVVVSSGAVETARYAVVAGARPPTVVRTSPANHKRDVALNAALVVVFSEPVDPASLTPSTVQLRTKGAVVESRLEFIDDAHTTVELTPAAPLSGATEYEIVVAAGGVRDLSGDALQSGLVASFATAADDGTSPRATWVELAPMATSRDCFGVAAVSGLLYAIGGRHENVGDVASVEAYDPATNRWSARSPMPVANGIFGTGVVHGIVYVVGGDRRNRLFAYDPATDTWSEKAPMPTPRWDLSVAVVGDLLYAIGGAQTASPWATLSTVEVYDPASDSWSTRAAMPNRRQGAVAVAAGGRILVIGGYAVESSISTDLSMGTGVDVYDPAADRWSEAAVTLTPRVYPLAAVLNDVAYVMGGVRFSTEFGSGTRYTSVDVLDPTKTASVPGPPLPRHHECGGAAAIGNTIYAVGGGDAPASLVALTP